jgi:predicted DNA-binding mobile mystery protein A
VDRQFKDLRRHQLDRSLAAFSNARQENRPKHGWLRAIRQSLGLSMEDVARKLAGTKSLIQQFEDAEKDNRITLGSLRRVADALGCTLVYAIVPKTGTLTELAEQSVRDQVVSDVHAVERTMALEDQAVGNVEQLVQEETKRRQKQ